MYLVCAEALTNLAKHSRATQAWVNVTVAHGSVAVRIADDGCGGAEPGRPGLRGLRDRVEALGGTLTIDEPAAEEKS